MSTALAPRPEPVPAPSNGIGALPEPIRQALELRKQLNAAASELAKLSWGKNMDETQRRAVAEYTRRYGLDPASEIELLGGRIYVNAAAYLRLLVELREQGLVEYAYADHVEADARLAAWPDEDKRRQWERIQHGIPDAAKGAVVFHIRLRGEPRDVIGVNFCGGGTRKNDPVGDERPTLTAESRATRRAVRQVATHLPRFAQRVAAMEADAEVASGIVRAGFAKARLVDEEHRRALPPGGHPLLDSEEPYGAPREVAWTDAPRSQPAAVVHPAPVTDAQRQRAEDAAAEPDPYDGDDAQGTLVEEPAPVHTAQRVDMPKGGAVAGALELNDRPRGRRNAVAEGQ